VVVLEAFIGLVSDTNVFYSYLPHLVTLAVMAPIFRIVLEGGSHAVPTAMGYERT
jgi:hypothetical protein